MTHLILDPSSGAGTADERVHKSSSHDDRQNWVTMQEQIPVPGVATLHTLLTLRACA
jgi:hypothetical protein